MQQALLQKLEIIADNDKLSHHSGESESEKILTET